MKQKSTNKEDNFVIWTNNFFAYITHHKSFIMWINFDIVHICCFIFLDKTLFNQKDNTELQNEYEPQHEKKHAF